jgi:hypothetical protein
MTAIVVVGPPRFLTVGKGVYPGERRPNGKIEVKIAIRSTPGFWNDVAFDRVWCGEPFEGSELFGAGCD